jgi:hypothetical protein
MPKHTPGPWVAKATYHHGDGKRQTGFYINSDTLMVIQGMPAAAMSIEEMNANAVLMTAAPELLASLKELQDWMLEHAGAKETRVMLTRSFKAIKKAEDSKVIP